MTVSTVVDHNDYTGNGVTTSFPYTFRIFEKTDLAVSVVDLNENITVLVLDTDYTVTNAGGYNGGSVVLTAPLATGWQISIARELEPTQETDLRNQGKFFAEVHEDAFDKLTMLIQQVGSMFRLALRKPSSIANWYDALNNYIRNLRDPRDPQDAATKNYVDTLASGNLSRTLRVPEPIPQLPDAATRANKIPAFDSAGNPIVVLPPSGSASDVLIELAKPNGVSLIGGVAMELDSQADLTTNTTVQGRMVAVKNTVGSYNKYSIIPNSGVLGDGDVIVDRVDGLQAELQVDDWVDVKAFAKAGRTDQQILQAALDYAGSVTGYCGVKVTAKNKEGEPWIFTGLKIQQKTILTGAGGWLKFADNICIDDTKAYYLVHNMGADDVHIRNLRIDGNQANNTQYAVADILTFGGARGTLKDVELVNAPDSCLMYATATDSVIDGLLVDNCRDLGIYCSASVAGGTRNCIITNITARNCAYGVIGFKRYVSDIHVSNVVGANIGNGITFEGFESVTPGMNPSNISINGVRLRDVGYPMRDMYSPAERAFSFHYARNIRIANADVINCSGIGIYTSDTGPSTGIYINSVTLSGYASNPQIVSGAPGNYGLRISNLSGYELNDVNIEGFCGYCARFFSSSAGSVKGGRWSNVQATGYAAFNGARIDAGNSFTHFQPDFISGISGVDLEWYAGATGIVKDLILNNGTGPAKYGYVVPSAGMSTPVGNIAPRFIGQEVWLPGTSKWWKAHGLTTNDWTVLN